MIDPIIKGFSTHKITSHLQICDHSIITFVKRGLCLGFSNTSRVDSLYRLRKAVVENFNIDINHLTKKVPKKRRFENANEFIHNMILGFNTTCVYKFIFGKYDSNDTNIIHCFVVH